MFTPIVLRRISTIVLFAFTSLTLQPLQAAVLEDGSTAPAAPDKSQRYGQSLEKIRDGLQVAKAKQEQGQNPDDDIALVRAQKAELDALEADVEADFAAVGQHLRDHNLPAEILARHEAAVAEFQAKKNEFKQKFEAFETAAAANDPEQRKLKLKDLADYMQAQQHKKAHTSSDPNKLPFRIPDENVRPPIETVAEYKATLFKQKPIHLAANGSISGITLPSTTLPATPTEADLAETEDIQLTDAIKAQAQALGHNPVQIHNWVRNNIEFIPSYGSIQGADLTLQIKRGNAFDTASLEIALLRASGIPARYVYGTVQIPADKAMNWVGGVNVPEAAQGLLGQGGIPNIGLASGGLIKYIKLEHVWVEAWVDYVPSRGAVNKTGDTWVPLDASYKQYRYTEGMSLKDAVPLDAQALVTQAHSGATINQTEGWVQNLNSTSLQTSLTDYQTQLKTYIDTQKPGATVGDVLGTKTIQAQTTPILMGSLPYKVLATGAKLATMPDNLRWKFRTALYSGGVDYFGDVSGSQLASLDETTASLAGKKITLSFVPATQADSDLINSYMPKPHADGTPIQPSELPSSLPGYLIHLKPELRVGGQLLTQSSMTVTMGQTLSQVTAYYNPATRQWEEDVPNHPIAGEYHALALDLQGIGANQFAAHKAKLEQTKVKLEQSQQNSNDSSSLNGLSKEDLSGDLLYSGILSYFASVDASDQLAARMGNQVVNYRLPSYGAFSATVQPAYWFGIPRSVSFPGVTMDVDRLFYHVEARDGSKPKRLTYMRQVGATGSAYENAVPERLFADPTKPLTDTSQPQGVSAVKALAIASAQGQKIYTLNQHNQAYHIGILAQLNIDADTKAEIQNALNAGQEATVHQSEITVNGWTGSGYILLDPTTGAGAYKISGGDNGGALPLDEEDGEGLLLDVFYTLLDEGNIYHQLISKFFQALGAIENLIDIIDACPGAALALVLFAATVITLISIALPMLALTGGLFFGILFGLWAGISISLLIKACQLAFYRSENQFA